MEQQKTFIKAAIDLSRVNVEIANGGPFGAVVVKDGEIVGKGSNDVTRLNDPTAHAEIQAIRDACKNLGTFNLEGCSLYASCEPCPMCLGSVYWANLSYLYFAATKDDAAKAGFNDAHIYKEFSLPKDKRSIPTTQLMREEAVKVFDNWMASEEKVLY